MEIRATIPLYNKPGGSFLIAEIDAEIDVEVIDYGRPGRGFNDPAGRDPEFRVKAVYGRFIGSRTNTCELDDYLTARAHDWIATREGQQTIADAIEDERREVA